MGVSLGIVLSVNTLEGCVIDHKSRLSLLEDWRGEPTLEGSILEALSIN